MDDHFPNGVGTGFGRLRLPEFQVERPVHILQLAPAFDKIFSHGLPLGIIIHSSLALQTSEVLPLLSLQPFPLREQTVHLFLDSVIFL